MALGAALAGTSGLGALTGTASAHGLTAFRDAFIGNDGDEAGLGSKGWLFFAKDSGAVYYHDGSGWQDLLVGGQFADTDDDGLLETPDHDGIDVGQVQANSVSTGKLSVADSQTRVSGGQVQSIPDDGDVHRIKYHNIVTDDFDTQSTGWDTSAHEFVARDAGDYYYNARIAFKSVPADTHVLARSFVSGSALDKEREVQSTAKNLTVSINGVARLEQGDTLYFDVLQESGSTLDTYKGPYDTNLVINKIA